MPQLCDLARGLLLEVSRLRVGAHPLDLEEVSLEVAVRGVVGEDWILGRCVAESPLVWSEALDVVDVVGGREGEVEQDLGLCLGVLDPQLMEDLLDRRHASLNVASHPVRLPRFG